MHTENRPRRLIVELNRDGSSGGERLEMQEFLVKDDGTETLIKEFPQDASEDEVAEIVSEALARALADAREAHLKIAGMQALVREKDALISAKDVLIDHFIAAVDSERRTAEGRASLHIGRIQDYQRAVEEAPKARGG